MSWKTTESSSYRPRWLPRRLVNLLKFLIRFGGLAGFLLIAVALYYFYLAIQYDLSEVSKLPERSLILDRNGDEFAAIHGERRRLIARDEIPETMVLALFAREDARFMEHHGVDIKGLARATLRNIKDRSFTQGASTLTMQLTRNSFELRAKSLHRKFLEIAITLRTEKRYTKDEILTHYLNRIYFGSGCHGVEEAAQTYFGRSTAALNDAECAMLVGIIRGPHIFSPLRNFERATDQKDEVLERMLACGYFTQGVYHEVMQQPVRLVTDQEQQSSRSYALSCIRSQLSVLLEKHEIRDGGLRIHTSIDQKMQTACEARLKLPMSEVPNSEDIQAALVKLDTQTGGVLAICGGRDFQKSSFNRAYSTRRDLGPMFEPFLQAAAIERHKVALKGKPVQTGRQLGAAETIRLSKRLGFAGPFLETEDLYRGALAATPMELALATAALDNGGQRMSPYFIEKITDLDGRELYRHQPDVSLVIAKSSASEALELNPEMLTESGLITATSACRDVWGIQLADGIATSLWFGCDVPRNMGGRTVLKKQLGRVLKSLR
ncbi:MAG: transglycosylase domain-containing protein [Akkermansiaceae bacterium]